MKKKAILLPLLNIVIVLFTDYNFGATNRGELWSYYVIFGFALAASIIVFFAFLSAFSQKNIGNSKNSKVIPVGLLYVSIVDLMFFTTKSMYDSYDNDKYDTFGLIILVIEIVLMVLFFIAKSQKKEIK